MIQGCKNFLTAQLITLLFCAQSAFALGPQLAPTQMLPDYSMETVETLTSKVDSEPATIELSRDGKIFVTLANSPERQRVKLYGTLDDGKGFADYQITKIFKLQNRIFAIARVDGVERETYLHELNFHLGSTAFAHLHAALAGAGVMVAMGAGFALAQGLDLNEFLGSVCGVGAGLAFTVQQIGSAFRSLCKLPPIVNTTALTSSGYRYRLATLVRDADGNVLDAYFKFKRPDGVIEIAKLSDRLSCEDVLSTSQR